LRSSQRKKISISEGTYQNYHWYLNYESCSFSFKDFPEISEDTSPEEFWSEVLKVTKEYLLAYSKAGTVPPYIYGTNGNSSFHEYLDKQSKTKD